LLLNQIRAQKDVIKSVFCNFLLDFNRLLKKKKTSLKGLGKRPLPPYLKGILLNKQKKHKNTKKVLKKNTENK